MNKFDKLVVFRQKYYLNKNHPGKFSYELCRLIGSSDKYITLAGMRMVIDAWNQIKMYPGKIFRIIPEHDHFSLATYLSPNSCEAYLEKERVKFYFNDRYLIHREDGPAVIASNFTEYYLNGVLFKSKQEWFEALGNKKSAIFNMDELV